MGLFLDCFGELPDARRGNARRHDLLELLTIALSATLCGAASCVDFERCTNYGVVDALGRVPAMQHVPSLSTAPPQVRWPEPKATGTVIALKHHHRGMVMFFASSLRPKTQHSIANADGLLRQRR